MAILSVFFLFSTSAFTSQYQCHCYFMQTDNATVSSEIISDNDDENEQDGADDSQDPEWIRPDGKRKKRPASFTATLVQREWIKSFCRAADRAGISDDSLFFMLRDFCVAHKIPLKDVILSPSTIKEIRKEVESESATRVKVGAILDIQSGL